MIILMRSAFKKKTKKYIILIYKYLTNQQETYKANKKDFSNLNKLNCFFSNYFTIHQV